MLTQAIPLGRLSPSGAPGGRPESAAAALESALSVLIERQPRATPGCADSLERLARVRMPATTVSGASRGNYQPRVSLRRGTPNPLASSPALVIPALSPAAEHALVQIQCSGGARFTHPSGEVMRCAQLDRSGRRVRSCLTVTANAKARWLARYGWRFPAEGRAIDGSHLGSASQALATEGRRRRGDTRGLDARDSCGTRPAAACTAAFQSVA